MRRVSLDDQIVTDEIQSIVNYVMAELEFQTKGSYLFDNIPDFEYDVYDWMIRRVRSQMNRIISAKDNNQTV